MQCCSSNCGTTTPAAIRSADIKKENTSGYSICEFKREPTSVQPAVAASQAAASTTAGAANTRPPTNHADCFEFSDTWSDPSDTDFSEHPAEKAKPTSWRRWWRFTWNSYPSDWLDHFSMHQHPTGKLHGYAGGRAVDPTTGAPHIQGWIDFGKREYNRPSILNLPKRVSWRKVIIGQGRRTLKQNPYDSNVESYVAWGTCIRHSDIRDIEHECLYGSANTS